MEYEYENRFAYKCWEISNTCYSLIEVYGKNEAHHVITGVVFAAFSFEAMLNHYGNYIDKDWNIKETKIKPREKKYLELLKKIKIEEYEKTNDFEIIKTALAIRDMYAHGKTVVEKSSIDNINPINEEVILQLLDSVNVNELINKELLKKVLNAIKDLQECIETKNPDFSQYPLYLSGTISSFL